MTAQILARFFEGNFEEEGAKIKEKTKKSKRESREEREEGDSRA